MSDDFYVRLYVGHRGKFGHEFLEIEFRPDGKLRYANNSNYKNDTMIRKEMFVSPIVLNELKRIVEDSEVMKEDDSKWPEPDRVGRQELEVVLGGEHISFATTKLGSLLQVQSSEDPEGLRVASKAGHSMTDHAVNSRLIGLFADPKIYAGAIGCFYLIFETLERVMEKAALTDERLSEFLLSDRPLFRTAQFQQDLVFFFGPDWTNDLETRSRFPAVDRYLDHLEMLAQTQPILLAAHAYTQHSAVASGGQIISKLVQKGLNLQSQTGAGTAAFSFSEPPRDLKLTLKSALDSLESELSNEEVDAMILQHQDVFIFNNEIIKGYRVGFFAPLIASVKLATRSRAVKVALVGGIALVVALYLRK